MTRIEKTAGPFIITYIVGSNWVEYNLYTQDEETYIEPNSLGSGKARNMKIAEAKVKGILDDNIKFLAELKEM